MKVAFQGTINYGGQGTFLIELTRALSRNAEELHIFPTSKSLNGESIFSFYGKTPENVKIVGPRKNIISQSIRDVLAFKNYDIVHVNYASYGLLALVAKTLYKTPFVYTIHYSPPSGSFWTRLMYRIELDLLLPFVAQKADRVVTISSYVQNLLKQKYNLEAEVVYHGINMAMSHCDASSSRDFILAKYGIPDDYKLFLYVGRFHGYKDLETAIKAFSIVLKEKRFKIKFLVVGKGEMERSIKQEVLRNKVEDHVLLLGDIENGELEKHYAGSDVFVFPSIGEGFGLVFLEAMICGLPIIASSEGSSPEVVGDAGLIFTAKDPNNLASKIITLLDNQSLYNDIKANCKKRASLFTWEEAANNYYDIYRGVLDRIALDHGGIYIDHNDATLRGTEKHEGV